MSYSILIITTAYSEFINLFLKKNTLGGLAFREMNCLFERTRYGSSYYHSKYWNELGHQATEIYANIEPFQKKWASEHDIKFNELFWEKEILSAQITYYKPNVLYIDDLYFADQQFRNKIRQYLPKVILCGWRFAPTPDFSKLNDLDIIFTGSMAWQNQFKNWGINSYCVPLCFEEAVLNEIKIDTPSKYPFTFIGSTGSSNGQHSDRYKLIHYLMENTSLEIWSNINVNLNNRKNIPFYDDLTLHLYKWYKKTKAPQSWKSRLPLIRRGEYIEKISEPTFKDLYPLRVHNPVFGLENYKILGSSKITFNMHINIAGSHAGNIRLFEATGMGACLVTDWKENISEIFIPDEEIITYKCKEEAIEKVNYLLDNEKIRQQIAANGQKRTLSKYTYKNRVGKMNLHIQEFLSKKNI